MSRSLHKLTAWLLLVVFALSGISPAQRLVVCVEPDGSIVLEAADGGGCTPCIGEQETAEIAVDGCACIDIPLPTQCEDPQSRPSVSRERASCAATLAPSLPATFAPARPVVRAFPAADEPRPAPGLALIRTVILRV